MGAIKKNISLKGRASYVTLEEARSIVEDGDKYYSVSLIMDPESDSAKLFSKTVKELLAETKWSESKIKKADKGLRDGDDREGDSAYEGKVFVNAKSKNKPVIVGRDRTSIDADKIYSGCYVNLLVSLYVYDQAGNCGVGVGLRGVQFVKDGEALGSTVSEDEFEELEDEDDDLI